MIEKVSILCFNSGILNLLISYIILFFSGQMQTLPTTITTSQNLLFFYEMLLKICLLFCFNCKENNPRVSMVQNGTMVTVRKRCAKCIKGYV